MSANQPREMASQASRAASDGGILGVLRAVALVAVLAGAAGSLGFMFREGRRAPRLLLLLFTVWVLSPFVVLAWANIVPQRWSVVTRATIHGLTLVLTLGSLAIYGGLIVVAPPGSANAFEFVIVPPVSWLLMAIVVPLAALVSRRRSHS